MDRRVFLAFLGLDALGSPRAAQRLAAAE